MRPPSLHDLHRWLGILLFSNLLAGDIYIHIPTSPPPRKVVYFNSKLGLRPVLLTEASLTEGWSDISSYTNKYRA